MEETQVERKSGKREEEKGEVRKRQRGKKNEKQEEVIHYIFWSSVCALQSCF